MCRACRVPKAKGDRQSATTLPLCCPLSLKHQQALCTLKVVGLDTGGDPMGCFLNQCSEARSLLLASGLIPAAVRYVAGEPSLCKALRCAAR